VVGFPKHFDMQLLLSYSFQHMLISERGYFYQIKSFQNIVN
jgi:hypothetical protein